MMVLMNRTARHPARSTAYHPHRRYIRLLGGPTRCAELLNAELKRRKSGSRYQVSRETVANWERRGVAGEMRAVFATVLIQAGHNPPRNFTLPRRAERCA